MKINVKALNDFIEANFSGDYKKFAEALKINSVTLWRVLNNKSNAGEKFLTSLMLYCKMNGHEFEYFFTNSVA